MKILNQYAQDGYKVTQYTKDGTTVSHAIRTLITKPVEIEPIEPQPTLEQRVEQLQQDNVILMDALATTFEELIMLREEVKNGGTA